MISPNELKIEKTFSMAAKKVSYLNSGGAPKTGSGRRVNRFVDSASINVEKDFGILSAARRASGSWLKLEGLHGLRWF